MGAISSEVLALDKLPEESSERTAHDIRQEISVHREAISNTINRLDDKIHEAVDWKTYVVEHPYVALGIAAGAGLLISSIFKRQPSPKERIMDALADSVEDISAQVKDQVNGFIGSTNIKPKSTVQTAVTTFVAKAATDYLKQKLSDRFSTNNTY